MFELSFPTLWILFKLTDIYINFCTNADTTNQIYENRYIGLPVRIMVNSPVKCSINVTLASNLLDLRLD